jgi:hypothetical protein
VRQYQLLEVARASVDHRPKGVGESDRALMRLIDACHLARPDDRSQRRYPSRRSSGADDVLEWQAARAMG